jgi:hypothetical protein
MLPGTRRLIDRLHQLGYQINPRGGRLPVRDCASREPQP